MKYTDSRRRVSVKVPVRKFAGAYYRAMQSILIRQFPSKRARWVLTKRERELLDIQAFHYGSGGLSVIPQQNDDGRWGFRGVPFRVVAASDARA